MANNIALANKFLPILDEIYKKGAATSVFDARVMTNAFTGVNEIKVLKVGFQSTAWMMRKHLE